MSVPVDKFIQGLHEAQIEVLRAFDGGQARFFDLEWHRKSRKTTLAINLLIRECCRYPNRVYDYVGPTYKQARAIVWDDPNMLDAYLPDKAEIGWQKNEQKLHVKFANGSILRVLGADDIDSLRGPDCFGVVFDEWALIKPGAWAEVYRPIMALKKDRWAMFLWTPKGVNHATDEQARRQGWADWLSRTLKASKSGLLPAAELAKAREEMPVSLYDQEFECSHVTDEQATLITSRMLEALQDRIPNYIERRRIISVDPALGGDKCVAMYMVNTEVVDTLESYSTSQNDLVGQLAIFSNKHLCNNFIVDVIGLGQGIANDLSNMGKNVQWFNSSEKANDPVRYANKKAEAWAYTAQKVHAKAVFYPEDLELRRQIPAASQYKPDTANGKLQMRLKTDVKKQIGCSPDKPDCWNYGIYGLQNVEPDPVKAENGQVIYRHRPPKIVNFMAV